MPHYRDWQVSLATMHGKERAIALPFSRALGLRVVLPSGLDTDTLGTFSGEVERNGTALKTCVRKACLSMAATGLPFGIANEGSFGPHPFVPFIPAGIEIKAFDLSASGTKHRTGQRSAGICETAIVTS